MNVQLDERQARVLGCLLEKAVTTPDQYPLTLNALTNACNQKSARDPVMHLDPGVVARTARELIDMHLVTTRENFRSSVDKYSQRLCNTRFANLQLEPDAYAVMTLLLLRGAQTPGELRARSGRLHEFADNDAVTATLNALMEREGGPLVARLPRKPGRRDHEYMHLFYGELDSAPLEVDGSESVPGTARGSGRGDRLAALESQLAALQTVVLRLAGELGVSAEELQTGGAADTQAVADPGGE